MSKFTDFRNFHTMLYTCAKEFDFIEDEVNLEINNCVLYILHFNTTIAKAISPAASAPPLPPNHYLCLFILLLFSHFSHILISILKLKSLMVHSSFILLFIRCLSSLHATFKDLYSYWSI